MNWSPLQNTSQCLDKPVLGVEHCLTSLHFFTNHRNSGKLKRCFRMYPKLSL